MRRILTLALHDLRLTAKDRPVLFWIVIMPVGFVFLFGSMSGGERTPRIGLTVVDEDGSFLSGAFAEALSREGFRITRMTPQVADTSAVPDRRLRVPAGFQDSIRAGRQVPVFLDIQPDANAAASFTAELHVQRAIWKTIVNLIASGHELGLAPVRANEPAAPFAVDEVFESTFSAAAAQPGIIAVEVESGGRGRPVPSGMNHSLPATITLFMLINTGIYGGVFLTQEKQDRVLARQATYPMSPAAILAGKLLGRVLIGLTQALILILAGRFLLGAYLGNSALGLVAVILCLAFAVAALALFWGAVLRSVEQTTAITLVVSLFLGAIGGCWWPLDVVPAWMRAAGHVSPAAWAMDAFHALISFGAGPAAVLLPCAVLVGYGLLFLAVGARLLRFSD